MSIHMNDLRDLHRRAQSGGSNSPAFILFSAQMFQDFEQIFKAAFILHKENAKLQDDLAAARLEAGLPAIRFLPHTEVPLCDGTTALLAFEHPDLEIASGVTGFLESLAGAGQTLANLLPDQTPEEDAAFDDLSARQEEYRV